MFNWNSLVDEVAISAVLSDEYVRFARPVREGLIRFLESLPAAYQQEIVDRQAELPITASISERLATLARSCPVLHKLGQVLARDQRLAPELRQHLRELESFTPTVDEQTIRATVQRELGPVETRGIRLEFPAIAEASVAVVVPFVQIRADQAASDDSRSRSTGGVLKILKPGIEDRLELELNLLTQVGAHLDECCHRLAIPHLDYEDAFQQIREKLLYEIRLDEEQKHLTAASSFYADDPQVLIPALLEHCTPRITAMERIIGWKITDHKLGESADRFRRLSDLVARALVARPFFSRASCSMFHSDPHAGNLFVTHDGRLAILDWSLVGWLDESARHAVVQIIRYAAALNPQGIVRVLEGLAVRRLPDRSVLEKIIHSRLTDIRHGSFPGMKWLIGLLDDAVQSAGLRFSPDLMLLRKSLHTLEGVFAEMGADEFQMDRTLLTQFISHFAQEWPRRWVSPFHSHDFATHLSNADLLGSLLGCPATAGRFWLETTFDMMNAFIGTRSSQTAPAAGAQLN